MMRRRKRLHDSFIAPPEPRLYDRNARRPSRRTREAGDPMSSQKIVRCRVRRRGRPGSGSVRYVPLEIFPLWEHLMTARHGFEVLDPCASLWLDVEDAPEAAYEDRPFDRVTEVSAFVYSERDAMFTRASRWFGSAESESLKHVFLGHYRDEGVRLHSPVRERPGIWLHRTAAGDRVARPSRVDAH
jgi:hypothetical protein